MIMKFQFPATVLNLVFVSALLTISCSAQAGDTSLDNLRQLTKDGKMPAESVVAGIESRYAGKKTGALAKLLRARIRFENKDFAGAATILDSPDFAKLTKVADYALWLRGRALQEAGSHQKAMEVFERLNADHPDSLRSEEARILWADSATKAGNAVKVPAFLAKDIEDHDAAALLATAKAYEALNDQPNAVAFYRRTYFYGAGNDAAKEAEAKLISLAQPLTPSNAAGNALGGLPRIGCRALASRARARSEPSSSPTAASFRAPRRVTGATWRPHDPTRKTLRAVTLAHARRDAPAAAGAGWPVSIET